MKYIRTKDGVYELVDTYYMCIDGVETYMYDNKGRGVEINSNQILKQSDSIDELCDRFVDEEQHYIIQNKAILKDIPNKSELKNHKIYGAIWVEGKGLIYVAKMNDKGELELI